MSAADVVRRSLVERLTALRGVGSEAELPAALLDVTVRQADGRFVVLPADWEQLRHEEGAAARPVPYWARLWPSGLALARFVAAAPPRAGARVLELGCGLALPSVAAAQAGALVLATDGSEDAIAFAAHVLALNEVDAAVAVVDWADQGEELVAQGPFDLVLAADVLYTLGNADLAARLLPRLIAPGGEAWIADPDRAGARRFLAAARGVFDVRTVEDGEVRIHRLRRR
jgi:predicted nicotinamide N-methyase